MARTSQFQINKMELIPRSLFEQSVENQVFTNNRLRLWFSGLCISLSQDRKLVAVYCDPNKIQSYINLLTRTWTEVHVRIIPQGDGAWFCADKSAGMRVGEV